MQIYEEVLAGLVKTGMKETPANAWIEFETFQYINHLPGHKIPFCGLCGNSGIIDTRKSVTTSEGKPCGVEAFCICPNGRAKKKKSVICNGKKWGGTSVLNHEAFETK